MKIVVVIPYFYPAFIYGGPVFAAYQLCQKVAEIWCKCKCYNNKPEWKRKTKC